MDKFRMHQILNVLLLPYREKEFERAENDIIAGARRAFAALQGGEDLTLYGRMYLEQEYYKAELKIMEFLKRHPELRISDIDDFKLILDLFFPEEEIATMYHNCLKANRMCVYEIDRFYLENLHRIAVSLITFRDGRAAVRTWKNDPENGKKDLFDYPNVFAKVEIWNLLSRMIVPDIVIAAFYVEAGLRCECYLYNQQGGIYLADKTLESVLNKGVAETHCHFNAGLEYVYLWQKYMDLRFWGSIIDTEEKYREFCAKAKVSFGLLLYRIVWAEYFGNENKTESGGFYKRRI